MNELEILEKKIEDIRNLANDTVPQENENWCYLTIDEKQSFALKKRIKKLHKNFEPKSKWHKVVKVFNPKSIEMYEIIIELEKKLDEAGNVNEAFMELVNKNCKLEKEIKLAIEALRCYAKSDNSELAKETLIKLEETQRAIYELLGGENE